MGTRGKLPDAEALKLRGYPANRIKKAQAAAGDVGTDEVPVAPSWLTKEEAKEFDQVVKDLAPLRILHRIDAAGLAIVAQLQCEYRRLALYIRENGDTVETRNGPILRPEARKLIKLLGALLPFFLQFGMTPLARKRMGIRIQTEKPKEEPTWVRMRREALATEKPPQIFPPGWDNRERGPFAAKPADAPSTPTA